MYRTFDGWKATVSIAIAALLAAVVLFAVPAQARAAQGQAATPAVELQAASAELQAQEAPAAGLQAQAAKSIYSMKSGAYVIRSAYATSLAVDTPDFSRKTGARMQAAAKNGSIAQTMYVRKVGKGTYTIQSACSGLYLTDKNGKVTQQKVSGKAAQRWKAYSVGSKVEFVNVGTGRYLSLASTSKASGTKLSTKKAASKTARFTLKSANLVPNGYYKVRSAGKLLLDVADASLANKANIQLWYSNGGAAQVWRFQSVGKNLYKITSDLSGKALEVKGGSKANGANVQQRTYTGAAYQKWRAVMREDGSIQFVNKKSGKALDAVSGGKLASGNVRQATAKDTKPGQGWTLLPTESQAISGDPQLDVYLRDVAAANDYSLRKCFNWVTSTIKWYDVFSAEVLPNGIIDDDKTIGYALYAFKNHKGDCYYYASAMKWLATACGYDAQARAGRVTAVSGLAPHGWTEVYRNGQTYVCDANLQVDIGGSYNWYMTTYDAAAVNYIL